MARDVTKYYTWGDYDHGYDSDWYRGPEMKSGSDQQGKWGLDIAEKLLHNAKVLMDRYQYGDNPNIDDANEAIAILQMLTIEDRSWVYIDRFKDEPRLPDFKKPE